MTSSRRNFLRGLSTGAAALSSGASTALATPEPEASCRGSLRADEILDLFEPVTGRKGVKIWAPATPSRAEFVATLHPHRMRFCASAFKGFVLCEALRQKDSINVDQSLRGEQLVLDESVWSSDSESFNPPYLSGKVSELTTLEAMIIHSDNTGADMILKHVGADHVRQFIAQAGLAQTRIPNSTRQFLGYVAGVPYWRTITWQQMLDILDSNAPFPNPALNDVQTMASSPHDFVSFYSRSLQGEFFKNIETLNEFRAILSRSDAIAQAIPLGASAFLKGGSADVGSFHALCLAGGMYVSDRWVYFALMLNWESPDPTDPDTRVAFTSALIKAFELIKQGV
jgi:beta-lactamase class A